jgi:hypothetical protein
VLYGGHLSFQASWVGGGSNKHLFIVDRFCITMAFVCDGGLLNAAFLLDGDADFHTKRCHLHGGGRSACLGNLKWQRLTFRAGQQRDFHFPETQCSPVLALACLVTLPSDLQAGHCLEGLGMEAYFYQAQWQLFSIPSFAICPVQNL